MNKSERDTWDEGTRFSIHDPRLAAIPPHPTPTEFEEWQRATMVLHGATRWTRGGVYGPQFCLNLQTCKLEKSTGGQVYRSSGCGYDKAAYCFLHYGLDSVMTAAGYPATEYGGSLLESVPGKGRFDPYRQPRYPVRCGASVQLACARYATRARVSFRSQVEVTCEIWPETPLSAIASSAKSALWRLSGLTIARCSERPLPSGSRRSAATVSPALTCQTVASGCGVGVRGVKP